MNLESSYVPRDQDPALHPMIDYRISPPSHTLWPNMSHPPSSLPRRHHHRRYRGEHFLRPPSPMRVRRTMYSPSHVYGWYRIARTRSKHPWYPLWMTTALRRSMSPWRYPHHTDAAPDSLLLLLLLLLRDFAPTDSRVP